jgi:phospholipid/cholesterol/gamma-HCH transport system substrate-binding protein
MRRLLIGGLVATVLGAGAWAIVDDSYHVRVVLDSATNVVQGGSVLVNGVRAGTVSGIAARDGKAELTLELDATHAPLHDGAMVVVEWKALLGERLVNITDGAKSHATVPDGGLLQGTMPQPMELDHVLNALDEDTRAQLSSLVNRLDQTVGERYAADLNAALRSAGPAIGALGEVLRALGTDGPAIKNLVNRLNALTATLAGRQEDVRTIVTQLSTMTSSVVRQRQQLDASLQALPSTLRTAENTLRTVPGAVAAASPLLRDARQATQQLPAVAEHLAPVLTDLRPLVTELGPALEAASALLSVAPGLLDSGNAVLPQLDQTITYLAPALDFLRPYTPEAAGFFATWASAKANYDANGHHGRLFVQGSAASLNENPGIQPPFIVHDPYPLPGGAGNQPWTDAFGSGER